MIKEPTKEDKNIEEVAVKVQVSYSSYIAFDTVLLFLYIFLFPWINVVSESYPISLSSWIPLPLQNFSNVMV